MSNYLKQDAEKVNEALAALKKHDAETDAWMTHPIGAHSADAWASRTVDRRALSALLEERAGILARFAMAETP